MCVRLFLGAFLLPIKNNSVSVRDPREDAPWPSTFQYHVSSLHTNRHLKHRQETQCFMLERRLATPPPSSDCRSPLEHERPRTVLLPFLSNSKFASRYSGAVHRTSSAPSRCSKSCFSEVYNNGEDSAFSVLSCCSCIRLFRLRRLILRSVFSFFSRRPAHLISSLWQTLRTLFCSGSRVQAPVRSLVLQRVRSLLWSFASF